MGDARAGICSEVFAELDKDGDGVVPLNLLREKFDPNFHPDCMNRVKSPDDVINEFLATFETYHSLYVNQFAINKKNRLMI